MKMILATGRFMVVSVGALVLATTTHVQDSIRIGFPIVMSGSGAQFGIPVLKGAQMYAEEVNKSGGVLGRKIEILPRDTKLRPDEVRVARELITRERVNFLVGTFTSAEGPAVSEIAKENKIVFIAPVPATDRLTAPDALHPYVFCVVKNTTTEGRAAAEILSKWTDVRYRDRDQERPAIAACCSGREPSTWTAFWRAPGRGHQRHAPRHDAQRG